MAFQPGVSYYPKILIPISIKLEKCQSQLLIPEVLMHRAIRNLNSPKRDSS